MSVSAWYYASDKQIEDFLEKTLPKLSPQIMQMKAKPIRDVFTPAFFETEQDYFYLFGKKYHLQIGAFLDSAKILSIQGENLILNCPYNSPEKRNAYLIQGCKDILYAALHNMMPELEQLTELRPSKITVKQMRSRWGSCNIRSHSISINLELVRLPIVCLRYIMIHELMHIHERLHNARFHALVQHYMPNWRVYDQYLKRYGIGERDVPVLEEIR